MKKLILGLAMLAITGSLFAIQPVALKKGTNTAASINAPGVHAAQITRTGVKGISWKKGLFSGYVFARGYIITVTEYDPSTASGTITISRFDSNGNLISLQVINFTYA